jgi:hypothetical protein
MAKYYVTGWSAKFGGWQSETLSAKKRKDALDLFKMMNPTLRRVVIYRLEGRV